MFVIGSTVLPQRYAAKFEPGISRMRVELPSAESASAASCQYCGSVSGSSSRLER
jgi:hypothetical protein